MIQQRFCEDCIHFQPTSFEGGYCDVYKCQEPRHRPASNCSDFKCAYKSEFCKTCINKEVCK